MSEWHFIMNLADNAMNLMLKNRNEGELVFKDLLSRYKNDGMIYYKRAQAYEKLGDYENAKQDYIKAKSLFPMRIWIDAASNGIFRMINKIEGNKTE